MKIANKKVAAIAYKLSISDSATPKKLVEDVNEKHPMHFLVGESGLPVKFEETLMGLGAGDKFDFTVQAKDGFGKYEEEEVMSLPIQDFLDEKGVLNKEVLQVGKLVPMKDEQGHHVRGRILEIDETKGYIKMDFNHPLAGKDMHFEGSVVNVREATKEEMEHGHVHGEGGHHH
jgi:FKBP-type peptidyl-prolyl cis-trans isomerase SlyD